jgi:hypothetical protein
MVNALIVGFGLLAVVLLVRWIMTDSSSESSVIDVSVTAEKRIEELTVEELHEQVQNFLMNRNYQLESTDDNGDYLARRDDETLLVTVDPAAQLRDPRKMNQLILNLRKSEAEAGILVTTRSISGQSRSLAEKADVRIVEPDELLDSASE